MLNLVEKFKELSVIKSTFHGELYNKILAPYENEKFTLLEIGICTGASLVAWHDSFSKVEIYGIDRAVPIGDKYPDISFAKVLLGDQSYPPFMEKVARDIGEIDVVIDDGGHFSDDQQVSFKALWPAVKQGGLYVMEDLWIAEKNVVDGFECTLAFLDKLDIRKEFYEGFYDFKRDICVLHKE